MLFAPYEMQGHRAADWDEMKERVADQALAAYSRYTVNLNSANIISRTVHSPLDLERSSPNSMVRGDVHGLAPYFYQSVAHRPTPDLGQFTVPGVERFYLVGPFMHPGGSVFGAGRATAMRMFDDLKLNFDKVANAKV
jgi:phytoene dehydrogenase-like protein